MPTYIEKIDTSDLSLAGATATRELSRGLGTDTNFTVAPANGGGTETHFFVTLPGRPASDAWEDSGVHTVEVEIDSGDGDIDCDVRVGRVDAAGTIIDEGALIGAQAMDVTRSFSPVAPAWADGEEDCANRYFVRLVFTNNAAHGNHSITVGVGTIANEVVTDVTEDLEPCLFQAKQFGGEEPLFEKPEVVAYDDA